MTTLTLKYFGLKARGEVPRLILRGAGIPFNDCRYDFTMRPPKNPETAKRLSQFLVLLVMGRYFCSLCKQLSYQTQSTLALKQRSQLLNGCVIRTLCRFLSCQFWREFPESRVQFAKAVQLYVIVPDLQESKERPLRRSFLQI